MLHEVSTAALTARFLLQSVGEPDQSAELTSFCEFYPALHPPRFGAGERVSKVDGELAERHGIRALLRYPVEQFLLLLRDLIRRAGREYSCVFGCDALRTLHLPSASRLFASLQRNARPSISCRYSLSGGSPDKGGSRCGTLRSIASAVIGELGNFRRTAMWRLPFRKLTGPEPATNGFGLNA